MTAHACPLSARSSLPRALIGRRSFTVATGSVVSGNEEKRNQAVKELITAEEITAVAVGVMKEWAIADEEHRNDDREDAAARLACLETVASFCTPRTANAALYQLGLARSQVDTLDTNHVYGAAGRLIFDNLNRLLVQLTRYVEATGGVTREQAGLLHYSDPRYDGESFRRN